ncbi:hypothetical protein TL16_g12834 [Triparma laevis f. inornata]|uniref:START domain-containing protein n=1 Tax=Triparma laevis f. inornata TaxID=1714386 RepID=A0A9W7BXH6_9STRA|nr:hypothetical protein TL16_g12834 [Triparma laevis f. inornata]
MQPRTMQEALNLNDTYRKEKEASKSNFSKVIKELNTKVIKELNKNLPGVTTGLDGMLLRDVVTKTISQNVHVEPGFLFRALKGKDGFDDGKGERSKTLLTFTAQVESETIRNDEKITMGASAAFSGTSESVKVSGQSGRSGRGVNFSVTKIAAATRKKGDSGMADVMFKKLVALFYERFQQEEVIDTRMKEKFITEGIPNAPPLIDAERNLIANSMNQLEKMSAKTRRIAGTANDTVEKYFYRDGEGGGSMWAMSVATIDVSAKKMFTELWPLDTYAKKSSNRDTKARYLWENLDGTRSLQHVKSVALPGFSDRLFDTWMTWEERAEPDGRLSYVIAFAPIQKYGGTRNLVSISAKMIQATTVGVYVIRECAENICEWTRAQHVDLKIPAMPKKMTMFLSRQQLGVANEVQEFFRRNGKEVDRERGRAIGEIMKKRKGMPLMEDQVALFERCKALRGRTAEVRKGKGWREIVSPCPDVEMWLQYQPPEKGERTVATGKAVGIVDGSVEEVAAWAYDYCSNERMRMHYEEGHFARLEIKGKRRENESTVATVKKLPVILYDREFVARQVWQSAEGEVSIAFESTEDQVDYGSKPRKVRGITRGFCHVEKLADRGGAQQCRLSLIMYFDAAGIIPTWVLDSLAPDNLDVVQQAIDEFRQDDKIDTADNEDFSAYIKEHWREEEYSEAEQLRIENGDATVKTIMGSANLKVLESGDPLVTLKAAHLDGDKLVTGFAESVVDGYMEEVAAFECLKMSREATRNFHKKGGIKNIVEKVNGHSFCYLTRRDLKVTGFRQKEFRTIVVWKKVSEDKMVVCYDDTDAMDEEHPRDPNIVYGSSRSIWEYERLPDVEGVPQTRVLFVARVDVAGSVPNFVMNRLVKGFAKSMTNMRKKFDKSLEIDATRSAAIKQMIEQEEFGGNESAEGMKLFEALSEERKGCFRPSRSFGLADSMLETSGNQAWGRSHLTCRASVEEVAAFLWNFGGRTMKEINSTIGLETMAEISGGGRGLKKIVEGRQLLLGGASGGNNRSVCTFMSEATLHRYDASTIIILLSPLVAEAKTKTQALANKEGSVVSIPAKETVAIMLTSLGRNKTKLEYACELELGQGVRRSARRAFVERRLELLADISIRFQRLVPLESYLAEDGIALAYDVLFRSPSSRKRLERFLEVAERSRALRELSEKLPWFKAMMTPAVKGNLTMNRVVSTKMVCLSTREARQIGKNLIPSLKSKKLIFAAVDKWRLQNRAVKELMAVHGWFEQFIIVLGKGVVKSAAWGLLWRVIVGAVLSVTDLATDTVVLKEFWDGGEAMEPFRNAQLASLVTSFAFQLLIVFVQNSKKGVSRVLKETCVVLVGLKSPLDAYRVAMGAEQEKDCFMDPMTELTCCKIIEIFAESFPGTIIQISAIISTINAGDKVSMTALISLLVSLLTTGFVSATMSYDFDTDPKKRAANPQFYGFVPDNQKVRAALFTIMALSSSVQVLLKGLLVALLGSMNLRYSLYYIVGDMVFYFVYKMARRGE